MSRSLPALLVLVAIALCFAAKQASAQVSIGIGGGGINIGIYPKKPNPIVRKEYVVTEYNPFTGGVNGSRTFLNRSTADSYRLSVARAHWVKWRFVGINEPLRWRRFSSAAQAQYFIANDGPSKTGKLGFAILTNETRAVATRVTVRPAIN